MGLDTAEFVMCCERLLGCTADDKDYEQIATVGELVEYYALKLKVVDGLSGVEDVLDVRIRKALGEMGMPPDAISSETPIFTLLRWDPASWQLWEHVLGLRMLPPGKAYVIQPGSDFPFRVPYRRLLQVAAACNVEQLGLDRRTEAPFDVESVVLHALMENQGIDPYSVQWHHSFVKDIGMA